MKKGLRVILLALLVCSLFMVAAEAKDYTILVMPKLVGIPYFNASEAGALKAGEDLGVNVIYAGRIRLMRQPR